MIETDVGQWKRTKGQQGGQNQVCHGGSGLAIKMVVAKKTYKSRKS